MMNNTTFWLFLFVFGFILPGAAFADPTSTHIKEIKNCPSICLRISDKIKADTTEKLSMTQSTRIKAVLINNTKYDIKVPASGSDWLYYEVMSDIDNVKRRYERHVFYFRVVRAGSIFNFNVHSNDLEDIYAIRLRYHYASEDEFSDELIHYVSWLASP